MTHRPSAVSTSIRWLHLTDLHQGMENQDWLWPGMKDKFHRDLIEIHQKEGPWDLILFTGDLVQGGQEYDRLNTTLEEILSWFDDLGGRPPLLAVPGNHDLVFPAENHPTVMMLARWLDNPKVAEGFWKAGSDNLWRDVISKAFSGYDQWWKNTGFAPAGIGFGLLPGDFSYTFEKGGLKLGIVGLNTAFLQLTKTGDYRKRLILDPRQFHAACGGDGEQWANEHHVCLLMTHHPPSWLDEMSYRQFNRNVMGRIQLHLCGHQHETEVTQILTGGADRAPLQWIGSSLFGLEKSNDGAIDREYGYVSGELRQVAEGSGELQMTPRRRMDRGDRWSLVPDQRVDLPIENCRTRAFSISFGGPAGVSIINPGIAGKVTVTPEISGNSAGDMAKRRAGALRPETSGQLRQSSTLQTPESELIPKIERYDKTVPIDKEIIHDQVDNLITLLSERRKLNRNDPDFEVLTAEIDAMEDTIGRSFNPTAGDIVANSRLVKVIGVGNFGTVWEAIDIKSKSPVAVKVFRLERLKEGQMLARFQRSIRAQKLLSEKKRMKRAQASSSYCVNFIGVDETRLAFSMALLDGGNLEEIAKFGWTLEKKLRVFEKICEAVAYAHANGIIHRDIKPANILLDQKHDPKLTDFDISDIKWATSLSTAIEGGLGTPIFAAPEQLIDGENADEKSDIYSLGRLLHYFLLERSPGHQIEKVPKLNNLGGTPLAIAEVVRRCTMYNMRARYDSVSSLLEHLLRCRSSGAFFSALLKNRIRFIRRHLISSVLIAVVVSVGYIAAFQQRNVARRTMLRLEHGRLSSELTYVERVIDEMNRVDGYRTYDVEGVRVEPAMCHKGRFPDIHQFRFHYTLFKRMGDQFRPAEYNDSPYTVTKAFLDDKIIYNLCAPEPLLGKPPELNSKESLREVLVCYWCVIGVMREAATIKLRKVEFKPLVDFFWPEP